MNNISISRFFQMLLQSFMLVRKTTSLKDTHELIKRFIIIYTNSNFTYIWNQGFWTSAPLPLSIGLLAEHNPSGECQQNKLYKPWICTLWKLFVATESTWFKVCFRPNFELNVSEIILYLHFQRKALFFPLWKNWRWNFSTPSTEESGAWSLLFCTFPGVTRKNTSVVANTW